ncbi:hypothetical protein ACVWY2_004405 [Bradyrhizobium sp. JR6.1]
MSRGAPFASVLRLQWITTEDRCCDPGKHQARWERVEEILSNAQINDATTMARNEIQIRQTWSWCLCPGACGDAAPGSCEPSRVASRPSGLDPSRKHITITRAIYRNIYNVSLAGGTRPRAPPSLHAGVAITVPRWGALLTGLATAVASGPAVIACPRRYHCPCRRLLFNLVTPGLISLPLQCPAFSRLRASRLRSPNHRTLGAAMAAARLFSRIKTLKGRCPSRAPG